ncbi:MAG: aminomethyl-transferring glycine dehydrogenase subunit GcvPA [Thermoleophilia bacterium]
MPDADVYPYIPNSVPEVKAEMLEKIGISSVEDIFAEIPDHLRFKGELDVPGPIESEYALRRHVEGILAKNKDCKQYIGFLGGGVYNHFVPSVVTTIMERDEFLTSYVGEAYADHGKWQAQFEYASCLAELLEMDAVNTPTYDWGMAAATSIRMAARIAGRSAALVAAAVSPDRLSCMKNYAFSAVPAFSTVEMDPQTGLVDLDDLKSKMTDEIAVFYYENPSFLGVVEHQGAQIAEIVHGKGGIVVAGIDPMTLGVLEAPARYGVDIACGDIQGLGIPMSCGGGQGGFVATQDEPRFFHEFPALMFGVTPTIVEGEYGFGEVFFERTSYASREHAKDFLGTMAQLHGIGAGVYLSLMGPQGMREVGEGIMQRSAYLAGQLDGLGGVKAPVFSGPFFKEFVVNFDGTGKTVAAINKALLERKIFGGKDLSPWFPSLGQSALYCVTEVHTKSDLDALVGALKEIL